MYSLHHLDNATLNTGLNRHLLCWCFCCCPDPEPAVKLSALTSLTHLVLGGMVKAKGGNVAQVAVLLVDDVQGGENCAVDPDC